MCQAKQYIYWLQSAKREGLWKTYRKAMNKLDSLNPLGYSCAGTVIQVGAGADEFQPGDRVACAGGGANHAEIVFVPKNLCVKVPQGLPLDQAAFTTLGAIAMQGVRRAQTQLGDRIAVIGLGLLGQITCQILRASGVHVIGTDIVEDKVKLAEELGVAGDGVAMIRALQNAFNSMGKHLPINVDGAIAALLVDLDMPRELANAFFIIARVPGLVAHIHEERMQQRPMRRIHPTDHELTAQSQGR